jgi:hypothetical protein
MPSHVKHAYIHVYYNVCMVTHCTAGESTARSYIHQGLGRGGWGCHFSEIVYSGGGRTEDGAGCRIGPPHPPPPLNGVEPMIEHKNRIFFEFEAIFETAQGFMGESTISVLWMKKEVRYRDTVPQRINVTRFCSHGFPTEPPPAPSPSLVPWSGTRNSKPSNMTSNSPRYSNSKLNAHCRICLATFMFTFCYVHACMQFFFSKSSLVWRPGYTLGWRSNQLGVLWHPFTFLVYKLLCIQ